jgi:GT2 family glycosyltransferase
LPDPLISVIIPTYNGASVLGVTLDALRCQASAPMPFETIIVDDGSTDDTESVVSGLGLPGSFRYIRQPNRGAAAARNHGASHARGESLLFLDSDVVPDPNLLNEHLESHQAYKRALIVGRTQVWPRYEDTVFYRLMGEEIFAFDLGDQRTPISYQEVVSRNFSLKREAFCEIGGFDEGFPRSGYEDTEFAFCAAQLGYQFIYTPRASGVHRHTGTLSQVGEHMYNYQISAALFLSKHPEAAGQIRHLRDKEPIRLGHDSPELLARKLMRRILTLTPCQTLLRRTIADMEMQNPESSRLRILYWQVLGDYLYRGYREGRRRYGIA